MTKPAPPPSRALKPLPRRQQLVLLGLAALAGLAFVFGLPVLKSALAPKPPAEAPGPPPGYFIATPEQWATLRFATLRTMGFRAEDETDGKIAANDDHTTQVFSPYTGRVTRIFVKVGDRVAAGQPLFAVQAAELAQAQSDLATAQAQVKLTQAAEERQHELYKSSGAALKDWQQSQADRAAAEAALAAVRNRLLVLGQSGAQIQALENHPAAGRPGAEAVVTSPIAGVVLQKSIGVGENIGSVSNNGGSNAALTVSNLATVWLVGNLREVDAPKARVGQSVDVRVAAVPDRDFTAKVDYVSPTVDPVTRRVTVRGEIANPDGLLKPEMFATFGLITGPESTAVGVPEQAVIYEADTARVWVAGPRRTLALRQIKAGETRDGMVQVLSGLAPGERVVTSGSLFIDRASQGD